MERLWAPWRMEYIDSADRTPGCILCDFPAEGHDAERMILHRSELAYIILNKYPYSNGHLMVAPFRHTADLPGLTDSELLSMMRLVQVCVRILTVAAHPDGFNIGVNLGRVAGAGVADHVHMHVVPRWNGDTNFMPVIGDLRVIPESLRSVYDRLKLALAEVRDGQS